MITPSSPLSYRDPIVPPTLSLVQTTKWTHENEELCTQRNIECAVWWPTDDVEAGAIERRLYGEIALEKCLAPTTAIAHFSIEVFI